MKGGIYMAIFFRLIACLMIMLCFINKTEVVFADENLQLYSGSYALTDGETGRVLKGKEEEIPMANASTTKILTCVIALESCAMDEKVEISANAASQPRVRLGVKEGEIYQMKELLYGLMLESYNDCAVAIAEYIAGDVARFAEMMNEKALKIGCKNTYFITPNGLDAEDETSFHHTTAKDLCKIMAYCTWESPKKDEFLMITQARNYGEFVNHNLLLNQMDGVLTGKTGFTNKAGYCYVAAMERDGEKYCIALLACGWPNNKDYKWTDARRLFEYGLENYDINKVLLEEHIENIEIDGFVSVPQFYMLNRPQPMDFFIKENTCNLLAAKEENVEVDTLLFRNNIFPIEKGEEVGECKVYLDNELVKIYPLYASDNAYMWGWKEIFCTIFYQFLTFSL